MKTPGCKQRLRTDRPFSKSLQVVPLQGLIDFEKERERLANQIAKLTEEKVRLDSHLLNDNFVAKAPTEKVDEPRGRFRELKEQITTLEENLRALT